MKKYYVIVKKESAASGFISFVAASDDIASNIVSMTNRYQKEQWKLIGTKRKGGRITWA
ncbi:hypothetical protein BpsM61_00004 [Bacillus phage vB_BpsM-61]|nr:hypothetical protein BpsM61_00004 [Bacillus phage vB_BpsM-61]